MIPLILGSLICIAGFVWMFICASTGWSDAWWYFDWQEFKLVLLGHLLVGGMLIGLGVQRILKRRKVQRKS